MHSRTSVFPLKPEEFNDEGVKRSQKAFMDVLSSKWKERMNHPEIADLVESSDIADPIRYEDDEEVQAEALPEVDDLWDEAFDRYISAKVMLPIGDQMRYGTVIRRKRDSEGNLIGHSQSNPILDTALYEVEFDDGVVEAYHANVIAEHIFEQIDEDGFTKRYLDEIIDHVADASAIRKQDGFYRVGGTTRKKRTTRGWKLLVRWKDGTTDWQHLKDVKESNPLELAEYVVSNSLQTEPAFAWWAPFVLRQRGRVVKALKKRYFRTTHKFGIELPKTTQEALDIDRRDGNTFWQDAIKKELKATMPAFEFIEDDTVNLVGYTEISGHMVFDVKMDFTRKARFVANPHGKGNAKTIREARINTYASVVTRESVRLVFLLAALNDLDLLAADVKNAYLNAPCRERVWFRAGPEFGSREGQRVKVVMALYGLFGSGAAWRKTMADVLEHSLGFHPCRADPDVWYRPATRANRSRYYEYVVVYTDDILAISTNPRNILTQLDQHFMLKPESIQEPEIYLGANITKNLLDDDPSRIRWGMSADKYVAEAIKTVERWLEARGLALKTRGLSRVLPHKYAPELDVSPFCSDEDASTYLQFIGILRWAVELARIDICTDVSRMASFQASPRQGHLDALCHIFAYLKKHPKCNLILDSSRGPSLPAPQVDWKDFYEVEPEELPPGAPEPLGEAVQLTCFVDASFAPDLVSFRSRTGVMLYVNRGLINFLSRRQNSIETSTFGAEYMALKTGLEMTIGLRYKLAMMGVPIDGPARIRCDNQSVVSNTQNPASQLKKKSNAVAYHFCRECCARGIAFVDFEPTDTNLADLMTKTLDGPRRTMLCNYGGIW